MNLLDSIQKLALESRKMENHKLTSLLYTIAMDVALVESNRYMQTQLKVAIAEAQKVKSDLQGIHMYKLSEELDIIARDLEAKLIQFSSEDPIQSVLNSYQIIHKIAQVKEEPAVDMKGILSIAEDDSLSDDQIVSEIKKRAMGLPLEDKKNIVYILEKDYNLSIPLEKIAQMPQEDEEVSEDELVRNLKTKEDKEYNQKLVREKVKKMEQKPTEEEDKWMGSFPEQPSIWSGFAYEAIVPYQQSNQMNFWSLASKDEEKILNKIARVQK